MNLNIVDIILIILLIIGIFNGFRRGLIHQLSALLGLILGLYGALYLSHFAINFLTEYISLNPLYIKIIAFILTFVVIVLIVRIVGRILQKTIAFAGLGFLNRLGGVLFSLIRYLFILSIIFMTLNFVNSKINLFNSSYFNHSIIYQNAIHPIILFMRQHIDSFFS